MNEKELIVKVIADSLQNLYKQDQYLIAHDYDNHVSERSIAFRFGVYFDQLSKEHFIDYNVDMEYNRNMHDLKRLPSWKNGAVPDLILHKRGTNDYNLLIAEIKPWWNQNQEDDKQKIEEFCDPDGAYRYTYGALILICEEETQIQLLSSDGWEHYEICRIQL